MCDNVQNMVGSDMPQTDNMRFAYWITKARIHRLRICLLVYGNKSYANARQCYVTGTMNVLFEIRNRSQQSWSYYKFSQISTIQLVSCD